MDFRKRLSALCHLLIVCGVVFASVATATNLYAEYLYVDNAAPCTAGSTCDGKSWATAWKSFSSIKWGTGTGLVGPADTLYISGGSTSKTYYETLTIGASGSSGSPITIDVGANSPSPSGHSGTVIIDGSNSRNSGIYFSSKSYVTVNGRKPGETTYKLRVQNNSGSGDPPGAIDVNSSNFINLDYIQVDNALTRGIFFDRVTKSRIRGCDIRTGLVANSNQTDGIYIQFGSDNIVENNTVVLGNNTPSSHVDVLQVANGEARLIVRGNWFEWADGRGNSASQVNMISGISDYIYIYNNVMIGSLHPYQVCLYWDLDSYGGTYYIWNNTIIARSQYAIPLRVLINHYPANPNYHVGAIKNNILVVPNIYPLEVDKAPASPSAIQGNLYYRSTPGNISSIGGTQRSWAAHRAAGYDNVKGVNAVPDYNISNGYRLNSTSPAIDAGESIAASYFATDKDGNVRPSGTGWDIGAYEYGASNNLALQPPSNLRVIQ